MKLLALAFLLFVVAVVVAVVTSVYGNSGSPSLATVAANIRAALPATDVQSVSESEIPGLYRFQAGDNTLYADSTGRYLLVGHIYDLQGAQDVTEPNLPPSVYGQPASQ